MRSLEAMRRRRSGAPAFHSSTRSANRGRPTTICSGATGKNRGGDKAGSLRRQFAGCQAEWLDRCVRVQTIKSPGPNLPLRIDEVPAGTDTCRGGVARIQFSVLDPIILETLSGFV